MITGLTYALLTTDDVPRARRFFAEKLGLSTEDDMGDEFSQFTTREGSLWAILKAEPGTPPHSVKVYLSVDDVDRAYADWKERGVEMVSEPWDAPFGRTFAFKDADGRELHAWATPKPAA
jgi:predicted enzyme related to lactoylglutathione lyase